MVEHLMVFDVSFALGPWWRGAGMRRRPRDDRSVLTFDPD
eukprot:CAMPEP_0204568042 /NCGR_PEP_ID=MMETSP0661-20131031/36945_1 /ASSEMBLY_ACC=CAM_ASM_000606 /TAXON_ID=109239 /ORGANISM="Alexandrium margalefi, Strain AMGDE01CS-322" /LENGTH=39 /DNA_ID= /DNA_START= /DNA_END= /DNA_ORIENTATION=